MAVEYFGEKADQRERVVTDGEVRYRRIFQVKTTDATDGPLRVSRCEGIPQRLDIYRVYRDDGTLTEEDQTVRVVEKRVEQAAGNPNLWYVECVYSDKHDDPNSENGDSNDDPESDPPVVRVGYETKLVAFEATLNAISMDPLKPHEGTGAVTSAGEPFDPPPEKEVCRTTLSITINRVVFKFAEEVLAWQNTINSVEFLGADARTLRLRIEADRVYRKGFRYWKVTYTFVHDKDTWDMRVLDAGTYYRDAADGNTRKPFLTEDDPPQPRIGLLDGAGDALDFAAQAKYITLEPYTAKNFHLLFLPLDIL